MAAQYHTIDLSRLNLSPGGGRRLELGVDPGEFELGGSEYAIDGGALEVRLDVSRTAAGFALRMRFGARLRGPCVRCLEPAEVEVDVDAREVDQPGTAGEELASPYVRDQVLDLGTWTHDALLLALPAKLLCRADCAGLCAVCGQPLRGADPGEHRHRSGGDPRWAKLRELLD